MKTKSKLHVGKYANRLDPKNDNPREVAFAKQWEKENSENRHILAHLIGKEYSKRDAMVAATIIQWLGSNIGMSFLEEAMLLEPKIKEYLSRRGLSER